MMITSLGVYWKCTCPVGSKERIFSSEHGESTLGSTAGLHEVLWLEDLLSLRLVLCDLGDSSFSCPDNKSAEIGDDFSRPTAFFAKENNEDPFSFLLEPGVQSTLSPVNGFRSFASGSANSAGFDGVVLIPAAAELASCASDEGSMMMWSVDEGLGRLGFDEPSSSFFPDPGT